MEGVELKLWEFQNGAAGEPFLLKYRQERDGKYPRRPGGRGAAAIAARAQGETGTRRRAGARRRADDARAAPERRLM